VRVVCALPYALDSAPGQRYRWEQWAPGLRQHGVDIELLPFCTPALEAAREAKRKAAAVFLFMSRWPYWAREFLSARNADAVIVFRNAALAGPPLLELAVVAAGTPLIYDFDDAIYLPPEGGDNLIRRIVRCDWRVGTLCRHASLVSVGNPILEEYAKRFTSRTAVWPTTISMEAYTERPSNSTSCPIIGWTGSRSTAQYFESMLPLLRELRREASFRVLAVGAQFDLSGLEGECVPWTASTEVPTLHRMDIGVMPLPDTPWARGKCALKALQYLAVGIPAVVSDVGVSAQVVPHETCGFVVRTPDQWKRRLLELIGDPTLRRRLGYAGREHVRRSYSAESWTPKIASTLRNLVGKGITSHAC